MAMAISLRVRTKILAAVAIVLSVAIAPTLAITVLSKNQELVQTNGALSSLVTLRIQCTEENFNYVTMQPEQAEYLLVGNDGRNRTLQIRCGAPKRLYLLDLVGYVPYTGKMSLAEVCFNIDNANLNLTAEAVLERSGIPRQALAADLARKRPSTMVVTNYRAPRRVTTISVGTGRRTQNPFAVAMIGGAIGGAAYCYLAGCGGGGVDPAAFQELSERVDGFIEKQTKMQQELKEFTQTVTEFQENTENRIVNITSTLRNFQNSFADLRDAQNTTNTNIANLRFTLERDLNAQRNELLTANQAISNNSRAIAQLAERTDQAVYNVTLALNKGLNDTNTALGTVSRNLEIERRSRVQTDGQLTNTISAVLMTLEREFSGVSINQRMNQLVHQHVRRMTGDLNLVPFINMTFAKPPIEGLVSNSEFSYKIVYDTLYVRSVSKVRGSPGGFMLYQQAVTMYCNKRHFVDRPVTTMNWQSLLSYLGGVNGTDCSTTSEVRSCNCWIEVDSKQCSFGTSPFSLPTWRTNLRWEQETTLTNFDDRNCRDYGGFASRDEDAPTVIRSSGEFLNYLDYTCSQREYLPGSTQDIYSALSRRKISVDTLCSSDIVSAYMPETPLSMTAVMINLFQFAHTVQMSVYGTYSRQLYGVLPNDITYIEAPIVNDGQRAMRCRYGMFMSFSKPEDWVPVYQMRSQSQEASATYRFDNDDWNTTSAESITMDFVELLPGTIGVVGHPLGSQDPLGGPSDRIIFDTPDEDVTLNPFSRQYALTYAMIPHDQPVSHRTVAQWKINSGGLPFDHMAAINLPSYYAVQFDDVQRMCSGDTTGGGVVGLGDWCLRYTNFMFSEPTPGTIAVIPKGFAAVYSFTIQEGTLIAMRNSYCPSTITSFGLSGNINFELTNTVDVQNTIRVIRRGPCASTRTVNIPPKGKSVVTFAVCILNNRTTVTEDPVEIWTRIDGGVDYRCPFNLTISQPRVSASIGVSSSYVEQRGVTIQDNTLVSLQDAMSNMIALNLQLTTTMAAAFPRVGIEVPPVVRASFSDIIREVNRTQQIMVASYNQTRSITFDYGAQGRPFEQSINSSLTRVDANLREANATLSNLDELNKNATIKLDELRAARDELATAIDEANKALSDLGPAFRNVANAISASGECSGFFANIGCLFKEMFRLILLVLFIGAVIYVTGYLIYYCISEHRKKKAKEAAEKANSGESEMEPLTKKNESVSQASGNRRIQTVYEF